MTRSITIFFIFCALLFGLGGCVVLLSGCSSPTIKSVPSNSKLVVESNLNGPPLPPGYGQASPAALAAPAVTVPPSSYKFTVTGSVTFTIFASPSMSIKLSGWTRVADGTNSITVPASAVASITNQPWYRQDLIWDAVTNDPLVKGYNIYWSTNFGITWLNRDTRTNTTARIEPLPNVYMFYEATSYSTVTNSATTPILQAMPNLVPQLACLFFSAQVPATTNKVTLTVQRI